jgi:hypothetical protein
MSFRREQVMIITWMDDRQETYKFTHQETRDGELHLWVECGNPGATTWRDEERWFPISNIRTRKAE